MQISFLNGFTIHLSTIHHPTNQVREYEHNTKMKSLCNDDDMMMMMKKENILKRNGAGAVGAHQTP